MLKMKKYKYTSHIPCHVVIEIKGKKTDFSFYENEIYELPENDSHVKRMEANGLLIIQKSSKIKK